MRRLVLMRHAKTEATNPHGYLARRLTSRGVQDSQEAGVELAELGVDYALVSTAVRARETFAATGLAVPVEFQDALYYHGTETMLARIGETDDEVQCLLVVAHAPTIPSACARSHSATVVTMRAFPLGRSSRSTVSCRWYSATASPAR